MNNLAVEQDIYNLRRNCDDKDAIIKELTSLLHSSDLAGSKVKFFFLSMVISSSFFTLKILLSLCNREYRSLRIW